MINIMDKIKDRAIRSGKKILFFETEDKRILNAASVLVKMGVKVVLVGNREKIFNNFRLFGFDFNENIFVIEMTDAFCSELSEELYKLRKHKNLSLSEARELVKQREYFSVMLVKKGHADCMIGGSMTPTWQVLKPALQILRKEGKTVSSFFSMIFPDKMFLFADCAMNIEPNADELANIAVNTAEHSYMFDMVPKIAMLSFSTKGSSNHESVEKVREATAIIKKTHPNLIVEGEMQADAAIVEEVARIKLRDSDQCLVMGDANVLIFPDLNSGNISYKLVQRLSNCRAIGPITVGFEKPVSDLSRGCSVGDIVDVAMISAVMCGK